MEKLNQPCVGLEGFLNNTRKLKLKREYDVAMFNLESKHKKEHEFENVIEVLKFCNSIKEFFLAIWKALCELVNYFGLLPETMKVSTSKESSDKWRKFVAQKGSEIVREHKLSPLN
jgi:hypothetical protein